MYCSQRRYDGVGSTPAYRTCRSGAKSRADSATKESTQITATCSEGVTGTMGSGERVSSMVNEWLTIHIGWLLLMLFLDLDDVDTSKQV